VVEQTEVQIPAAGTVEKPTEAGGSSDFQAQKYAETPEKPTEDVKKQLDGPGKPSEVYNSAILGALRPVMRENAAIEREKWVEDEAPALMAEQPAVEAPKEDAPQPPRMEYRLIGVYKNTYLLLEQADALVMIDQHAAHERILYEKYKRMLEQGTASQQLLTPLVVRVSAKERALIEDNLETLSQAGFEVESFGDRDVVVRAVPFVLSHASLSPFFMEMIEQLDRLKSATLDRRRGELIQLSCKRAVKAGDRLNDLEIQALLDEMARTSAPPTCPHGRPVMRVFRVGEIERMFKRQQ
jgi:DNA mismatch repair protein MutL